MKAYDVPPRERVVAVETAACLLPAKVRELFEAQLREWLELDAYLDDWAVPVSL